MTGQLTANGLSRDVCPAVHDRDPDRSAIQPWDARRAGTTTERQRALNAEFVNDCGCSCGACFDAVLMGESLYTLAEIAAGHGDRLAQDGMLAQPRSGRSRPAMAVSAHLTLLGAGLGGQ